MPSWTSRQSIRTAIAATLLFVAGLPASSFAKADPVFEVLRSYYATDPTPLDLTITERSAREGVERTGLSFAAFDNERITARLETPVGVANPPVVILLHGITQSLEQWWRTDDGPYSFPSAHRVALLDAGIAVLAIDARNHGSRKGQTDFENPYVYVEKAYFDAARKMISQSAIDVRRALDVIETLDGVDAERVGVAGFSLGAWIGYIAAAVDPRIDSAAIMAMPFLYPTEGHSSSFTSQFAYVGGLEGRPLAYIAAREDHFYAPELVEALVAAIPTRVQLTWVDGGHDLPVTTAAVTRQFFEQTLR